MALSYVYANSGCVAATLAVCLVELVCVCVLLVRVVIICLASTHTALVSSPSLAVLHLSTYLPMAVLSPTQPSYLRMAELAAVQP